MRRVNVVVYIYSLLSIKNPHVNGPLWADVYIYSVCVLYTFVFRRRDPSVLAALRRMVRMLINIISFGAVCVCVFDDVRGGQNARNVYKHTLLKGSSIATEVYKCIIYNIMYIVDYELCIVIIMYTRWFKTIFFYFCLFGKIDHSSENCMFYQHMDTYDGSTWNMNERIVRCIIIVLL